MLTVVANKDFKVEIGDGRPTVIIAERINPTGRKVLSAQLGQGSLEMVEKEALKQKEAGGHIIDVNVGAGEVDEMVMLPMAVKKVSELTGYPVSIDSSNADAIVAALKVYEGRALINSVTGEESLMEKLLPVAKEYGAAIVGLAMDESGIPPTAEGRLRVAEKILMKAKSYGLSEEDLLIDPLTMTVATDPKAGEITLEAVELVATRLGINVVLGASNVSFGLPERPVVNMAFLAMAIGRGMTAVISDPTKSDLKKSILAADVLMGRDQWAQRYICNYRAEQKAQQGS
ncbi:MAG: dihydropteroate synthase [Bacillota bacterium]